MRHSRDCPGDMRRIAAGLAIASALVLAIVTPGIAAEPLATEDYMVPASDPGIELFVRNKHPAGQTDYSAARTVLFVHGSTYPAEATFDLALDGVSWMDFIAQRGFDVYLLDLRGYGRSTRPKEMSEAPAANEPVVTTEVAIRDVAVVIDNVLQHRHVAKLDLIGWSWGTTIVASYAVQNPDKVGRLVLYGPQWVGDGQVSGKLGSYRTIDGTQARDEWLAGVPRDRQGDLIPSGWFERWMEAVLASDPVGAAQNPPVLRAPNGTVRDSQRYWRAGVPFYDPAQIVAPVLLIHGEWDRNTPAVMSQALFPKLKNAPWRRYVVIGEATHMLMLEKNRQQLFGEVQLFLEQEEPLKPLEIAGATPLGDRRETNGPELRQAEGSTSSGAETTGSPETPQDTAGVTTAGAPANAGGMERAGPDAATAVAAAPAGEEPEGGANMIAALMKRAEAFSALGDISAARLFYERAADGGSAQATTALAKTYDPAFLPRGKAVGVRPDPAKAAELYRKAMALDVAEAPFCNERLKALGAR